MKITRESKDINLGCYDDPEEAAHIFDAAERLLRGPDANLNFPDEKPSFEHRVLVREKLAARGILVSH